ncbi:MAG: hypothetical protein HYV29_01000 [Ignavibacteriales bacterium]|nr:hypothetical protein [Ignavibacteriales bacterium]
MVTLGIFANEDDITRVTKTRASTGTDEMQLARAARTYDCAMTMIRRHDPEKARMELMKYLRRGIPLLVCVDEWNHWITIVKSEQGQFIILDSQDKAVLQILTWRQLKKMWVYHERDTHDREHWETIYDLHPVAPRFRVTTKAKFSIARAKFLRRFENRKLALLWDKYVEDLLSLCRPRTHLSRNVFSLGEFLRRHQEMIVSQVCFWHGDANRREANKILNNMHFVADTYGLVIHDVDEKRTIAGITSLLTLWAAAEYGVDDIAL